MGYEWRDIKSVPHYQISSDGEVKFIGRLEERIIEHEMLMDTVVVRLYNWETSRYYPHRVIDLMMETFADPGYRSLEHYKLVQMNGNPWDFRIDNLGWARKETRLPGGRFSRGRNVGTKIT